jgi:hypothetical protein
LLKKTITYENPFTGEQVTEEHYFHISKADLVEMEMEEHKDTYTTKEGENVTGMQAKLQRIVDSEDGKAIMAEFKDIIRRSYGKKDGTKFLKSPEIWNEFAATEAFSQLLFDICTDAQAAAEFINGVVPGNLEQVAEEIRQRAEKAQTELATPVPSEEANGAQPGPRVLTLAEAQEMDKDELQSGLTTGRYKFA